MSDLEYRLLLGKARDAKNGGGDTWGMQSTSETLAVALVLNRADCLAEFGYSLVEAIDRVRPEWVAMFPRVVRALDDDS